MYVFNLILFPVPLRTSLAFVTQMAHCIPGGHEHSVQSIVSRRNKTVGLLFWFCFLMHRRVHNEKLLETCTIYIPDPVKKVQLLRLCGVEFNGTVGIEGNSLGLRPQVGTPNILLCLRTNMSLHVSTVLLQWIWAI